MENKFKSLTIFEFQQSFLFFFPLFFLLGLFFVPTNSFGQREKVFRQFPESYFDSIRTQVYDTSGEHYTIEAHRLSGEDEIVIDGQLNEPAWWEAEHKGNLLEKGAFPTNSHERRNGVCHFI